MPVPTLAEAIDGDTPRPDPHANAHFSPPRGWNSYTGYSIAVTEAELLKNIDFLSERLLRYGYDTVTVDNGWFLSGEGDGVTMALDTFGRPESHPHFFPNGLKYTIDYAHKKGVKFGIWLLRGINRRAVEENLPVEGTKYRMKDIVNLKSACPWAAPPWWNYGVDMTKAGAQEYYDGLVKKFADMGVDFIKFDDIVPNPAEVDAVAKAIKRCGRPVVLSLSPGDEINVAHSDAYKKANMVRITSDIWDNKGSLETTFKRWEEMQAYTGRRREASSTWTWSVSAGSTPWTMVAGSAISPRIRNAHSWSSEHWLFPADARGSPLPRGRILHAPVHAPRDPQVQP